MKLVSVIVPSFNAGEFLEPALRSVLQQSHRDVEVLVVDDGGTDGSVSRVRERLRDSRVRWFHQPNAGKPAAMNLALSHASGEYYALQDADDVSYPDRLSRLAHALEQHEDLAAVFSGHDVIVRGRPMAPTRRPKTRERCRRDIARMAMPAHDPTAMYRLSLVGNLAYETSLPVVEGLDYVLRVGEVHPMLVLGECLYSYRIHASSVTHADPIRTQTLVDEVRRRARERRREPPDGQPPLESGAGTSRRRRDPENGLASHFILSVQDQRNQGQRWPALRTGLQCARLHPLTPQYLEGGRVCGQPGLGAVQGAELRVNADSIARGSVSSVDLGELKRRSVRGGLLTFVAQGTNATIGLISAVILARLLSPHDYGVVAMVAAVTAFAGLFRDLGLSSASVQRQTLTLVQQSNLFWVNVAFGAALTIAVAASSPLVSWFYGRPELVWVTVAMSLNIAIGSVAAQSGVLLVREMRFGRQAIAATSGAVVGLATTIALATNQWGYWSLVWGQSLGALTTAGLLLTLSPFRPGWPRRGTGLKAMLGFGMNVTAFDVVNYFARNLDNVLIGRVWGVGPLGQYSRAYSLLMLPISNLRGPIMTVAFPALSRLQAQPEAYRAYYLRATSVLAAASMPLTMYLLVAAGPAIQLLLGEQWSGVAPIVSYLAIAAFIQPASGLAGSLLLSRGQGRRYLKIGIVNTAFIVASFAIGLPWGPVGVALSYAVVNYVLLYPWLTWAFRGSPVSFADFARACAGPATASLVAAACAFAVRARIQDLHAGIQLVLLAIPFGAVGLVSLRFTPQGRRFWSDFIALRSHVSPLAGRAA